MASFEKKLTSLLGSAVKHNVVNKPNADALQNYATSGEWEHKGWLSLSTAVGGLGALVLGFGIILLIASNWHMFGDPAKLIGFLTLLIGSHAAGFALDKRGYPKMSGAFHFLGAGLFIAGIGLIAQIFNLSSSKGESFLIWAIMIAPLAFTMRNGAIALLAIIAFYIWGIAYIDYLTSWSKGWLAGLLFSSAVAFTTLMGGMVLRAKGSDVASYLVVPGALCVMGWLYALGFTHDWGGHWMRDGLGNTTLLLLPLLVLTIGAACWFWLFNEDTNNRQRRMLLLALSTFVISLALLAITAYAGAGDDYIKSFQFGWTKKIYILPLFVSISAWISYFAIAFWGTIYGALTHKRWLLNGGVALIGIGIFTRFLDLIGTMMDTGLAFIVCGVVLLLIGFKLEKWRKKLILKGATS